MSLKRKADPTSDPAPAVRNDFSRGSIAAAILGMALPMILAQFVNVLYNIVDRFYIGRMPENAFVALTGLGICLPVITMVLAFANLFGMGGAPLCAIERGRGNNAEAERIMGSSFVMLVGTGLALTVIGFAIRKPMLYAFGASDITYPYAEQYLTIYLLGNVFVMVSLGMNHFINAQGFSRMGMLTVVLGAVANIILDPVFIFVFDMGVRGAALATILSQFLSALWVFRFLTGPSAILRLKRDCMRVERPRLMRIMALGLSGFVMQFTNFLVQVVTNASLQQFGGDLYIGIMTVINSVREIVTLPVSGLSSGAQPVMGFNFGARQFARVKQAIRFTTTSCVLFTTGMWIVLISFPGFFIGIFSRDPEVIAAGIPVMRVYFGAFFMMSLQFAGQSAFVALGQARQAIFFSLFRKVVLVIPLILILPHVFGLGRIGVFLPEPISEAVGGTAAFATMLVTMRRLLREDAPALASQEARRSDAG